jgi:hypothetical protein
MLIASGAFSLSAGLVLGKTYVGCQLVLLKLALTTNAFGILFGSIAVYGEAKLHIGILTKYADNQMHKLQGTGEYVPSEQLFYALPWWVKSSEIMFYSSLILSLTLWVAFIWTK